jgi:hypothetical protein
LVAVQLHNYYTPKLYGVPDEPALGSHGDASEQLVARQKFWIICSKIVRGTAFFGALRGLPYPSCP